MHEQSLFDEPAHCLALGAPLGLAPGDICLWPGLLTPREAAAAFAALRGSVRWRHDRIKLFGREHELPRLTAWHGDRGAGYVYSGIRQDPQPWTDTLVALRRLVEAQIGLGFNSVLLNLYRDGNDTVAWHADDEPELGPRPVIASLSVGATRRFRLRRRDDHSRAVDLEIASGCLLVMRGESQAVCDHTVPRMRAVKEERINLTFRRVQSSLRSSGASQACEPTATAQARYCRSHDTTETPQ